MSKMLYKKEVNKGKIPMPENLHKITDVKTDPAAKNEDKARTDKLAKKKSLIGLGMSEKQYDANKEGSVSDPGESSFKAGDPSEDPVLKDLEKLMKKELFNDGTSQASTDQTSSPEATKPQESKEKGKKIDKGKAPATVDDPPNQGRRFNKEQFTNLRERLRFSSEKDREKILKGLSSEQQDQLDEYNIYEAIKRKANESGVASYMGLEWEPLINEKLEHIASGKPTDLESDPDYLRRAQRVVQDSLNDAIGHSTQTLESLNAAPGGIFRDRREEIKSYKNTANEVIDHMIAFKSKIEEEQTKTKKQE